MSLLPVLVWKPCFPENWKILVKKCITNIGMTLDFWVFLAVLWFFVVNFFLVFSGGFQTSLLCTVWELAGGGLLLFALVTNDRWHMTSDTWPSKKNVLFCQFWYKGFCPHTLSDLVSPVCRIFKAYALWADVFYKSKCPSVCSSVCLSVCQSVCLFTFEVTFKRIVAPTSQSRMSKVFRDSESFGKSNGKNWSRIWKLLVIKGVKLPRAKKIVLGHILPYWTKFFWYWCFSLLLTVFFPKSNAQTFEIFGILGEKMLRSGLGFDNFCS